jgi:hypothetical protein
MNFKGNNEAKDEIPLVGSAVHAERELEVNVAEKPAESSVAMENMPGAVTTFVMFGGVAKGFAIPPFEFRRILKDVPVNKIFVRDIAQGWYQHAIQGRSVQTQELFQGPNLTRSADGQRVFIGSSMGGFAALMFGALLGADRVIAFAPQSFIDPFRKASYRDRRWWRELISTYLRHGCLRWSYDVRNSLSAAKHPMQITIFYGAESSLDRIHAERLSNFPGVSVLPVEGAGHDVVRHLRASGRLTKILQEAAETRMCSELGTKR